MKAPIAKLYFAIPNKEKRGCSRRKPLSINSEMLLIFPANAGKLDNLETRHTQTKL
jgi:hypothetical protein